MGLFKFRNLALACFGFLIALYISFYTSTTLRIVGASIAILTIFVALILFLITRRKLFKAIIFRYAPLCLFIVLAITISFTAFDKAREKKVYCDESEHLVVAKVDRVLKATSYSGEYIIDISKIDDTSEDFSIALHDDTGKLLENDIICVRAVFVDTLGKDLGNGINFGARVVEYISIEAGEMDPVDYFRQANTFLDSLFKDSLNESTYELMSAMFLGNRERLDESTSRDFARVGLAHILSLSGMHVSIFMAIVCFFISKIKAHKLIRILMTMLAIFAFIAITGFQKTALRAGIMQFFFFASFYIWERPDISSSLFFSLFLICLFDPYAVFSFSLLLSFLAMLGCICTGYIMKKNKLGLKCRTRVGRFCLLTLGSTIFVTAMTIPLVAIKFKQISLFSFLSNLIISPVLNILIYIAPLMLIVAKIPYASEAIAFVCEGITYICTLASRELASLKLATIPIETKWQLAGAFVLFIGAWMFVILSKKRIRLAIFCALLGFVTIIASTSLLYLDRADNYYISTLNETNGDAVFIESNNELTVIEASDYTLSSMLAYYNQVNLGYTEIESFIACDYNHRLATYIDALTDKTIVRCVYLQKPDDEKEAEIYNEVLSILDSKRIPTMYIESSLEIGSARLNFCESDYNASSERRSIVYSVLINNVRFTYLGASSYELVDYFPSDYARASDYIIFGEYGPSYKTSYNYELPCLDYCCFLGNSKSFASAEVINACSGKELDISTKIRIPR